MYTYAIIEQGSLTCSNLHGEKVCLQGREFVGQDYHALGLFAKTYQIHNYKLPLSELLYHLSLCIHQIKMPEAILLTPVEELRIIPRKETDGMLGLYIFIIGLSIESSLFLTINS